jgi:16S rRNA (cytosine1402-N4)-methyltransferase
VAAMHRAVLLQEAVANLVTSVDGHYVDGTFGRGGHSQLILDSLSVNGHLLGVDKDLEAKVVADKLVFEDPRFKFFHGSFAQIQGQLGEMGMPTVDGILLDLGVSSPQLDESERGFSFSNDGPLDMRMDTTRGETAAQWLAVARVEDIIRVLRDYGEERFAKRIAGAIVEAREEEAIVTTARLAKIVSEANPQWERHKHPATRSFQAIRIFINRELDDLKDLLDVAIDLLVVGGRLVVISFHSLEDRIVKRYMRDMSRGDKIPAGVPVLDLDLNKRMKLVGKAVKASDDEVSSNVRSRSAVMRVAEKIS